MRAIAWNGDGYDDACFRGARNDDDEAFNYFFLYEQINVSGEQYAGEAIAITTGLRLAYNVSTDSLSFRLCLFLSLSVCI